MFRFIIIFGNDQVKEFIGSPFADPRKVHASLVKENKFSLWIDIERLRTTNQNEESLGMVSQKKEQFPFAYLSVEQMICNITPI